MITDYDHELQEMSEANFFKIFDHSNEVINLYPANTFLVLKMLSAFYVFCIY